MSKKKEADKIIRFVITVFGVVQGVGYRPYIFNQAKLHNIKGWVNNQGSALVMDIEGAPNNIKDFLITTIKKPPSLAFVESVKAKVENPIGYIEFTITNSIDVQKGDVFIANDVSICTDCLNEILRPDNRRYNYAFTNCTACGPRYSIIEKLPYDRENTTMSNFEMCFDCKKEYNDQTNRRFHAQPNCCPSCGPSLSLFANNRELISCTDPIKETIELLQNGKIVAIKGIGGFHLSCNACDDNAVKLLRIRKNRPHKPFALMVKDLENAKKICYINKSEELALLSNKRPIVLLEKRNTNCLSMAIAPNNNKIGIMLPYSPLHYLLFESDISSLVMTSANTCNTPIQIDNTNAFEKLNHIADYFLLHNRKINIAVEDSVVKVLDNIEIVVRRGRGYSPFAFPMRSKENILAMGAEERSTFCLSQNSYGYMSQYLGDLKDLDAFESYIKAIDNLQLLLGVKPKIFAYDYHSKYNSTTYGSTQLGKKMKIQHHHAHMVSCMVEHNLDHPVIGVIFDGTGLGLDQKLWGGEFFVGSRKTFKRVGHFDYITIQGGDLAMKEPWRIAVSYLHSLEGNYLNVLEDIEEQKISLIRLAIDKKINCFDSSSVGRLFDCIAAIINLRQCISYEAQAAIELENIIDSKIKSGYSYLINENSEMLTIDYKKIIMCVLEDIEKNVDPSTISAKFHNTIGNITVEMVRNISRKNSIKQVVLSGGVFENNYLLKYVVHKLSELGFNVYFNQQIPTNDSGISVGQLAIADAMEG